MFFVIVMGVILIMLSKNHYILFILKKKLAFFNKVVYSMSIKGKYEGKDKGVLIQENTLF